MNSLEINLTKELQSCTLKKIKTAEKFNKY